MKNKPLAIGGVLLTAGAATWLFLSGRPNEEEQRVAQRTRDRVTEVMSADGAPGSVPLAKWRLPSLRFQPDLSENDADLADQARQGNPDAALRLVSTIEIAAMMTDLERACAQYGLTIQEYWAIQNAYNLKAWFNQFYLPDLNTSLDDQKKFNNAAWKIIQLFRVQAQNSEPFHPLFLEFLGIDTQKLKDRLQEFLVMTEGTTCPGYDESSSEQLRDDVREFYEIP